MDSNNQLNTKLYIGTSGWSYGDWKGFFYPEWFASTEYLMYYSQFFNSVEINSTFYHFPRPKTVISWANMVPDDFKFCLKLNRAITHYNKLIDAEGSLSRFFTLFEPIKNKLGPILVQLPYSYSFDKIEVEFFFELLCKNYPSYRFALEARHKSWFTDNVFALLKKYSIIQVISNSDGRFPYTETVTANEVYYRFHGPEILYNSHYNTDTLKKYALQFQSLIKDNNAVWAFFNNTMHGYGIDNALTIEELACKTFNDE